MSQNVQSEPNPTEAPPHVSLPLLFLAIAFSMLGITLAALLYAARTNLTEPGGRLLGPLGPVVFGSFAILSVTTACVVTVIAWAKAPFSRGTTLAMALPFLGTISIALAISLPVGQTLLRAINRQDVGSVRRALRSGVDPNVREIWGWHYLPGNCALTLAARGGNAEIVRLLIDHGAAVNVKDCETPLLAAARTGHLEIVALLLESGADVNHATGTRNSAYRAAVQMGHPRIAEELLRAGAKAEVIPNTQDIP